MSRLEIYYDEQADVVTICGVRYTGELFRRFGLASPGTWLRIEERRSDGNVVVFEPGEETRRSFDAITGRGLASHPK